MNNELVPADVRKALDRMCTPLDQSVLKGATAEADARSMQIIRDYIERQAALAQQQEAEPVAWIITGTDRDLVPRRYLLFSGREAELHVAQNLAGGEWQSCAAKPLYLHPPRPAAQPQVPDGWVPVPIELVQFLNGTGELEGMDFGSYPSPSEGDFTKKYWWRKYLPKVPDGTISAAKEEGKDV